MHSINLLVNTYFSHIRTEGMTEFMYLVSRIFDVSIYSLLVTILISALIYLSRGKRYSILFFSSMVSGAIISYLLKSIYNVARPTQAVFETYGQSFPSYHAVIVTIFFFMMFYIFGVYLRGWKRSLFNLMCVSGVVLISFSRIYLGVHWLSDVLGGILLGLLISFISVRIHLRSK